MATPAQVYAALTIENTFSILYPTAPINSTQFTDATAYSTLGYTTGGGDAVSGIYKLVDPVGQVVYENTGYATDVFSSSDWSLSSLTTSAKTLLTYSGTDTPIYGMYKFYVKIFVEPSGGGDFVVEKLFNIELNSALAPTLSLEETYDCNRATYTSTDTTVYGAPAGYTIQSIVRTHITRPPLVSKKSDGVTAQPTVTSSSVTNFLSSTNNPLWTGAYSSSIASVVTYVNSGNTTIVNCAAIEKDATVSCDNALCTLYCYLKKLYNNYYAYLNAGNTTMATMELAKWQKGTDIFVLIQKAVECSTGDVEGLTKKFYDATGITQGCDCGCSGDEPAPVIQTVSVNGTNGTDGTDGAPGAAGAQGAAGQDGAAVLSNQISQSATTTTGSIEPLKTFSLPVNTLNTNGDMIHIHAVFKSAVANAGQIPSVSFNGSTVAGWFFSGNLGRCVMDVSISRLSNTSISFENNIKPITGTTGVTNQQINLPLTIGGLNLTTTAYTIAARGYSVAVGDIICEELQVTYSHKI